MNQRSKLIMAGLLLVLLAGFNLGETCAMGTTKQGEPYILKERPRMNRFNTNERFAVQLKENISTGYSWHYRISPPEAVKCVEIIRIGKNQTSVHRVGASSECLWQFQGTVAGKSEIEFKYYRSWEGEKASVECHVYDVTIMGK